TNVLGNTHLNCDIRNGTYSGIISVGPLSASDLTVNLKNGDRLLIPTYGYNLESLSISTLKEIALTLNSSKDDRRFDSLRSDVSDRIAKLSKNLNKIKKKHVSHKETDTSIKEKQIDDRT